LYVEWNGHCLIWSTLLEYHWQDCGEQWKTKSEQPMSWLRFKLATSWVPLRKHYWKCPRILVLLSLSSLSANHPSGGSFCALLSTWNVGIYHSKIYQSIYWFPLILWGNIWSDLSMPALFNTHQLWVYIFCALPPVSFMLVSCLDNNSSTLKMEAIYVPPKRWLCYITKVRTLLSECILIYFFITVWAVAWTIYIYSIKQ
jgi:hypothetical protein